MSVVIVLDWLRHNHTHAYLAEQNQVSQPTISRLLARMVPVVTEAATELACPPSLSISGSALLVDGTLIPTWNWRCHKENYSGKRHKSGLGIQVVSDLKGRLVEVSEPYSGSIHDTAAYGFCGYRELLAHYQLIADSGYQGTNAITPYKATKLRPLSEHDKKFNRKLSSLRSAVERCIAHLKTWKVLATGYRRPLKSLPATIFTVMALQFYRNTTSTHI